MTPEEFLAAAERGGMVLDVRAPGEHAAGHLPGAVSFPLFTDEERARVGTAYKQESKQVAVDLGLELVGPKLRDMAARARALFEAQDARTPLLVHCWRGGMRSGSVDWLLRTAGGACIALPWGLQSLPGIAPCDVPNRPPVPGAWRHDGHCQDRRDSRTGRPTRADPGFGGHGQSFWFVVWDPGRPSPAEHGAILQRFGLGAARPGPRRP